MNLVLLGGGLTMVGAVLATSPPRDCHPAKTDSPYDTQRHCGSGGSGWHQAGTGGRRSAWFGEGIARGGFGASGHGAGAGH